MHRISDFPDRQIPLDTAVETADRGRDIRFIGMAYDDLLKIIDIQNTDAANLAEEASLEEGAEGHPNAKELWRLLNEEREILAKIKMGHVFFREGEWIEVADNGEQLRIIQKVELPDYSAAGLCDPTDFYLAHSIKQREIKAMFARLGMARLLDMGDWSVNRVESVPEGLGVVPFAQVESDLLQFHRKHGLLPNIEPVQNGRLVTFHVGCGNGILPEKLRRDRHTEPFPDSGHHLNDYFVEVGFADRIYYTLGDLLHGFLREDRKDDPIAIEFVNIISTLLLRKIFFARKYLKEKIRQSDAPSGSDRKEKQSIDLSELSTQPSLIRDVFVDLKRYVKNLDRKKEIRGDQEFLMDRKRPISSECQNLIASIYQSGSDAKKGLSTIFKEDFFDREVDLAEHITMWFHRVILGKFEDISRIFPPAEDGAYPEVFDFAPSFRASSHLQNQPYKKLILDLAYRLKPGGIILDDGVRESYTRQFRWYELDGVRKLLKRMEDDPDPEKRRYFKVEIIADADGPKSLLLQRGVRKEDGTVVFLESDGDQKILRDGCFTVPVENFETHWPEIAIRSEIIRKLKKTFIDRAMAPDDTDDARARKLFSGRHAFEVIHGAVDEQLKRAFKGTVAGHTWHEIRDLPSEDERVKKFRDEILKRIRKNSDVVRERVDAVLEGVTPTSRRNPKENPDEKESKDGGVIVTTFPPKVSSINADVARRRQIEQKSLPRNDNLPSPETLETERMALVEKLFALKQVMGKKPIEMIRFDDCFTNPLTINTLIHLLGGAENFVRLVQVTSVKLKNGEVPPLEARGIKYIGGSVNFVDDPQGVEFTRRYSADLLRAIDAGEPLRALGVCFGHQSLVTAYGQRLKYDKSEYKHVRGALQFGPARVAFANSNDYALKHLSGRTVTVPMTRAGHVLTPERYELDGDLTPLAYEDLIERSESRLKLPPVAFSMLRGRVITTQAHADVQLTDRKHVAALKRHLVSNFDAIKRSFCERIEEDDVSGKRRITEIDSVRQLYSHLNLSGVDSAGEKVPWIVNDFGPALLIPTLDKFTQGLLSQLERKTKPPSGEYPKAGG